MAKTIELYTMLKDKLGEAESKALVETIGETSCKCREDGATKADIARLEGKMDAIEWKMKLYFIALLFVILLTSPKALDLAGKLLGLAK